MTQVSLHRSRGNADRVRTFLAGFMADQDLLSILCLTLIVKPIDLGDRNLSILQANNCCHLLTRFDV